MLTCQQTKTLEFIRSYTAKYHRSPTSAEIAKGIGISSRGVVYRYLKGLQDAGHINLLPKRHRNIQLNIEAQVAPTLPLVGKIAAGDPIEVFTDHEMLDIGQMFLGKNRFALRVCGQSMIDEGILDGDLVVCERANQAQSGQIVVALIDQAQATLKRIKFPQHGMVQLLPSNPDYLPQEYSAERIEVQGIYCGLLRLP